MIPDWKMDIINNHDFEKLPLTVFLYGTSTVLSTFDFDNQEDLIDYLEDIEHKSWEYSLEREIYEL
jgi:hypothetical protein